ncbi:MAG: hypothetical protein JGK23_12130 [Microcoleus sp. PH2017_19_SFW_U_A]|nr:hypothetical protein [Microcoleus sp. PH2017_19_SFW_U_A]
MMDNFSCYLLVTGNWWWVIINLKNYSSTGYRSFCGTYGALLLTFYHDIPCDRLFSEILKNH